MKTKVKAFIHYSENCWESPTNFEVFPFQFDDVSYRTFVCEQEIEIEVPDNYDPRPQKIAALEKEKQKIMADFQKSVDDINNKISKLQAISFTA